MILWFLTRHTETLVCLHSLQDELYPHTLSLPYMQEVTEIVLLHNAHLNSPEILVCIFINMLADISG